MLSAVEQAPVAQSRAALWIRLLANETQFVAHQAEVHVADIAVGGEPAVSPLLGQGIVRTKASAIMAGAGRSPGLGERTVKSLSTLCIGKFLAFVENLPGSRPEIQSAKLWMPLRILARILHRFLGLRKHRRR